MSDKSTQVMLPFANLPTTDCVRGALANVIRDVQREHDLTDQQLADKIGVHVNTVARARNKAARLGAMFGDEALRPYTALWSHERHNGAVLPALADAMAALSRAAGPKGELDSLPAVKAAIEALSGFADRTEIKRLRLVS